MYLDEAAVNEGAAELLSITVDGVEHGYEATVDADGDGVADTVHVDTGDGSYSYTDTDGDGIADALTQFDADGHVSGHAVFDAATENWDATERSTTEPDGIAKTQATAQTRAAAEAAAAAGPATIDSDGDGVADTAITYAADGSAVLATDTDGDGAPDVVTEFSTTGEYSSYQHHPDGQWTEVDHGTLTDANPSAPTHTAVTDPATGLWVRR